MTKNELITNVFMYVENEFYSTWNCVSELKLIKVISEKKHTKIYSPSIDLICEFTHFFCWINNSFIKDSATSLLFYLLLWWLSQKSRENSLKLPTRFKFWLILLLASLCPTWWWVFTKLPLSTLLAKISHSSPP